MPPRVAVPTRVDEKLSRASYLQEAVNEIRKTTHPPHLELAKNATAVFLRRRVETDTITGDGGRPRSVARTKWVVDPGQITHDPDQIVSFCLAIELDQPPSRTRQLTTGEKRQFSRSGGILNQPIDVLMRVRRKSVVEGGQDVTEVIPVARINTPVMLEGMRCEVDTSQYGSPLNGTIDFDTLQRLPELPGGQDPIGLDPKSERFTDIVDTVKFLRDYYTEESAASRAGSLAVGASQQF